MARYQMRIAILLFIFLVTLLPVQPANASTSTVRIEISRGDFTPVNFAVTSRWNSEKTIRLSTKKPAFIFNEPDKTTSERLYGSLYLGESGAEPFQLILDSTDTSSALFYIDTNRNGDLTDDGPAIRNQGTTFFATALDIPFYELASRAPYHEPFSIWIFTNDSLWEEKRLAYYSRTQLKGSIVIDGMLYDTYLVDQEMNDANLTNDGICIDLNRDGQIDYDFEFFPPGTNANINGRSYHFDISW